MVKVTCHPALPPVWADHDRLEQVFVNLLDNAIRHNPPGTRVRVAAEPGADGEVVIGVRDDGVGLPPDLMAAPFEPKRRGHSASAGAGLGLSIAQGIVAAHGGRLQPGETGKGASFEIRLPVEGPVLAAGPSPPGDTEPADGAVVADGSSGMDAAAASAGPGTGAPGSAGSGTGGADTIGGTSGKRRGARAGRRAAGGAAITKAVGNGTSSVRLGSPGGLGPAADPAGPATARRPAQSDPDPEGHEHVP
jgi:hypothetical protein